MSIVVVGSHVITLGDLGGLTGADAHCQSLAAAVGAGARTWQAYLSKQTIAGAPAVNARDRIGHGQTLRGHSSRATSTNCMAPTCSPNRRH